jgi:signal transduction histidine kinase
MSHELRTPLNAIIGVSEMLREDAEALQQDVEPLDRVLGAARHLLALINDILDLSKIEAGRMELQLEVFALAPLIASVVKTIEPLAAKNENRGSHVQESYDFFILKSMKPILPIRMEVRRVPSCVRSDIDHRRKIASGGVRSRLCRRCKQNIETI